ncbi:glutaredoxin domain-containing protein [Marinomonas pollencensis]|uniref:Glutaredoxin 1/glutaredoxin 3 n=1 Tax=Marinomonas pollencensis TaxID=491954 RepID=A0A3E0DH74_9GAMM|nr:glutaredoxin domain-containing protein [Marinomonas pollencensis]REG81322.1 glutaredoxin 1/glutaredoxin 3 [Marinomonas pollencensis]
MAEYILYGDDACLFCRRAREVLDEHQIDFTFIDVLQECISKSALSKIVGHEVYTLPQVFKGDNYLGGYHELQKSFQII